jgi:hypothetical protein
VVAGTGFGGGANGWALDVAGFVSVELTASVVAGCVLGDDSDATGSSGFVTTGRLFLLSLGEDILEDGEEVRAVWDAAAILWGGDVAGITLAIAW